MEAVELSTKITPSGEVVIPRAYTKNIPEGSEVRVLILWGEFTEPQQPDSHADDESLNALIAQIKGRPLTPAYAPSFNKIHADDWVNLRPEDAGSFDPAQWNREWDELECALEVEENADQENWRG